MTEYLNRFMSIPLSLDIENTINEIIDTKEGFGEPIQYKYLRLIEMKSKINLY